MTMSTKRNGTRLYFCLGSIFFIVILKWNGKLIEDVNLDEGESVECLKRVIETQYNIPSKKQKLLFKGKMLKVRICAVVYSDCF